MELAIINGTYRDSSTKAATAGKDLTEQDPFCFPHRGQYYFGNLFGI